MRTLKETKNVLQGVNIKYSVLQSNQKFIWCNNQTISMHKLTVQNPQMCLLPGVYFFKEASLNNFGNTKSWFP